MNILPIIIILSSSASLLLSAISFLVTGDIMGSYYGVAVDLFVLGSLVSVIAELINP